jgi:hypothetical protein
MTISTACAYLEAPNLDTPGDQYALEVVLQAAGVPRTVVEHVLVEIRALSARIENLEEEVARLESPDADDICEALDRMYDIEDVVAVAQHAATKACCLTASLVNLAVSRHLGSKSMRGLITAWS